MCTRSQNNAMMWLRRARSTHRTNYTQNAMHCIISMLSQCDHQIHRHLLWPWLMRETIVERVRCLVRTAMLKNITNVNIWSKRRWFDRSPFWENEQANIFIPFSLIACPFASRWNFEVSVFGSMPFWSFSFFFFIYFIFLHTPCSVHNASSSSLSLCLSRSRACQIFHLRLHPFGMPFGFLSSFDLCMFLLMTFFLMNNFFFSHCSRLPMRLFAFVMQWSFISNELFDFSAALMHTDEYGVMYSKPHNTRRSHNFTQHCLYPNWELTFCVW